MDRDTAFSGTVGTIAGNLCFAEEYDFGLLVLQPGRRPNGRVRDGRVPCWLITFRRRRAGAAWVRGALAPTR